MKNRNNIITALLLTFGFLAFLPKAQAVSPAPDGGYPGANTAEGQSALLSLTTGTYNTAVGIYTLKSDTTGSFNTAIGAGALVLNTSDQNTATGFGALFNNTSGFKNTANGALALFSNTFGYQNAANGAFALQNNTEGIDDTATGTGALFSNTIGGSNTADGAFALYSNTAGNENTANGDSALNGNTTGIGNTADGDTALYNNTTGSDNTAIGDNAGSSLTTGDNNIDIGFNVQGVAGESNTIRIGNTDITDTFIRGISGSTVPNGVTVIVNGNGRLGTIVSSARFKDEIKPMGEASEAILALKPVTFRYKKQLDPAGTSQFGLVAEQVEKVNPDLVARDAKGEVYTVRYEAVNAMLLNEFLKEHQRVEEQQAAIAQMKKEMETVVVQLKEQAAQIQKVSARFEVSEPCSRIVLNNSYSEW